MEMNAKVAELDVKIQELQEQMQKHLEMYHQMKGALRMAIEFRGTLISREADEKKKGPGRPKGSKNKRKSTVVSEDDKPTSVRVDNVAGPHNPKSADTGEE
jgi:DUF4097 and DUF4098 domain-containing protein YvlB